MKTQSFSFLRRSVFACALLFGLFVWGCALDGWAATYSGWVVGDASDGYGTILYTTNGGETWTRQGKAGEIPDVILVSVSAVNENIAWAVGYQDSGYGTILHTHDGGKTWERQGSPAEIPNAQLLKVRAVGANTAWVVGYGGTVLRTLDGGRTWKNANGSVIPDIQLQGVAALNADTAWVSGVPVGQEGIIFHTIDGGQNWEKQGSANGVPADSHFIGISAASPSVLWAVGGPGFLIINTRDGGANWKLQFQDGQMWDANEVDAIDENTAWVAEDVDHILLTQDGGDHWTNRGPDPVTYRYMMGVSAADANTVWVVGIGLYGGIILHSTDGGQNWDRKTPPAPPEKKPPDLYEVSIVAVSYPVPTFSPGGIVVFVLLLAGLALFVGIRTKTYYEEMRCGKK